MNKPVKKVKFVDFWNGFKPESHYIYKMLSKHYELMLDEKPDYLFYGPYGHEHLKYADCVKICQTSENIVPDFNLCDYGIGFEYLDYGDRYMRYPCYYAQGVLKDLELCTKKHLMTEKEIASKTEFCAYVYSNANADKIRTQIFYELSKYKPVNAGGRHLNNVGQPGGVKDKLEFQKKHKFAIAFENSAHSGYATEKIVQAFAAGTIPIYWGDPTIAEQFNEKAFVNVNHFATLEEACERVKEIDANDELFLSMLREPAIINEEVMPEKAAERMEQFLCHIMEQEKESAYRRNLTFWGEAYGKRMLDWYNNSLRTDEGFFAKVKRKLKGSH